MKLNELASLVAKKEGKKKQVLIGDIREVIGIFSELIVQDPSVLELLIKNGKRRLKIK